MTHTVQTSAIKTRSFSCSDFYQVEVENYEGETYDFTVEAESFEEASSQVASLCSEQYIDVYNMNIYKF